MDGTAIVLTNGRLRTPNAKTAHGLVRGSRRYVVVGLVDAADAGRDAGVVVDGRHRGIPIFATLEEALARLEARPDFCVVGIATHGGRLTRELHQQLLAALQAGLSVVNGLHDFAGDDPQLAAAAGRNGVSIVDVRRPPPRAELHFWSGAIFDVAAPRLAVLGTDCALGKRTTARLLVDGLAAAGVRAEMIYTGQTGWMQGFPYGFILDTIPNDFVTGELEHAVVTCDRERSPDLIVLEGQSALRSPSGPCGAELLLSAAAGGVILQHAPGRRYFEGYTELELEIPSLEQELNLIEMYGARVLAVALNGAELSPQELAAAARRLGGELGIPVVRPLEEGAEELVEVARRYLQEERP